MHKSAAKEAVTSLHDLSAVDLIAGFRAKQFSPSEVLDDVLAHVAVWEPHIKALYAFDPEGARATAKASTERWQKGEPMGALDGVPITIKENIATKGVPVPLGTAATQAGAGRGGCAAGGAGARSGRGDPRQDHHAGLRHAVVGPLELPSAHPQSLEPRARTPAAPAPARAPRARPAMARCISAPTSAARCGCRPCWCGLVALKPSLGRIPIDPPYVGRVAGPMTRTVDDAALMMSVLSQPDRRDGMSLPPDNIDWKALDKSVRKLRIGLMLDLGVGQALEQAVRDVAVKAARAFEAAGAIVTEVAGVLTREMLDGLDHFWRVRIVGRSFQR